SPLLSLTTTPRTAIYTLSLHDALPICTRTRRCRASPYADRLGAPLPPRGGRRPSRPQAHERRADGGTTGPARLRHRAAGRRPRVGREASRIGGVHGTRADPLRIRRAVDGSIRARRR